MANSFVQLPSEILIDPDITALDLRIYAILMDFGFKGRGFSQIGHQHLGRLVGKHPATIAKSIKRLAELGYISVEKIGFTRNDIIRCKKTIKKEESKAEVRVKQSERTRKVKKPSPSEVIPIIDRSTKKRYKSPSDILTSNEPKPTPHNSSTTTPHPLRSTQTLEAIKSHQPLTDRLSHQLYNAIRPTSYEYWFKNMAVIDDDDDVMTISTGHNEVDWIKEHYSNLLDKMVKKKVLIVD